MNWAWASSLDQIWRSPAFPMWLTLAAAGFFGIIVLVTLLRAEKSVANGALTVITLLGSRHRGCRDHPRFWSRRPDRVRRNEPPIAADDRSAAGIVLHRRSGGRCRCWRRARRHCSARPTTAAAAVSYAASRLTRLIAFGDVATANGNMTPELQNPSPCRGARPLRADGAGAARARPLQPAGLPGVPLADRQPPDPGQHGQRTYDGLVARYAPSWNAPPPRRSRRLRRSHQPCPPANPPTPIFPRPPRPRRSAS